MTTSTVRDRSPFPGCLDCGANTLLYTNLRHCTLLLISYSQQYPPPIQCFPHRLLEYILNYVFCFVQNFFLGQYELEYFFILSWREFFFPEFNIRLYDKNLIRYFFFLHQNQNIFFSITGNQNIFLEKTITPLQVKWSFPYNKQITSGTHHQLIVHTKYKLSSLGILYHAQFLLEFVNLTPLILSSKF